MYDKNHNKKLYNSMMKKGFPKLTKDITSFIDFVYDHEDVLLEHIHLKDANEIIEISLGSKSIKYVALMWEGQSVINSISYKEFFERVEHKLK